MRPARRKIVFVIGSLSGGGAERFLVTLLCHLDRTYFEPHLVLLRPEGEFVCHVPADVAVHVLRGIRDAHSGPGLARLLRSLVRLMWDIRPQTVLSTGGMNLALTLARPFFPSGVSLLIRESSVLSFRLKANTQHPHLWKWLYRCLYRLADNVVAPSDSIVKEMVEQFHLPPKNLLRVYNPIDIEMVRKLGECGGNPYPGSGPQLVAVGRLSKEKGFDVLLAAMPGVVEALPHVRLAILGQGPLKSDLAEQAKRLCLSEIVTFPGFQHNPWPYIRNAHLFVLPSRYESFGNALLEALALGTPAVAVDCPGSIREIYGCNPAVRLVPAADPTALAKGIVDSCMAARLDRTDLEESRRWLVKFAVQRIMAEYSALFLKQSA